MVHYGNYSAVYANTVSTISAFGTLHYLFSSHAGGRTSGIGPALSIPLTYSSNRKVKVKVKVKKKKKGKEKENRNRNRFVFMFILEEK